MVNETSKETKQRISRGMGYTARVACCDKFANISTIDVSREACEVNNRDEDKKHEYGDARSGKVGYGAFAYGIHAVKV